MEHYIISDLKLIPTSLRQQHVHTLSTHVLKQYFVNTCFKTMLSTCACFRHKPWA